MPYRNGTLLFLILLVSNMGLSFGSASSDWSMTDPEYPLEYVATHDIYPAFLQSPSSAFENKTFISHDLIITYDTCAYLSQNLSFTLQSLRNHTYTGILSIQYPYQQHILNYSINITLLPYATCAYNISSEIAPHIATMSANLNFSFPSFISTGMVYLISDDFPQWQYKYAITFCLPKLEKMELLSSQPQTKTFQYHTSMTLLNDGDNIPDAIYNLNTPSDPYFKTPQLIECYSNYNTIQDNIVPYPISYLMRNISLESTDIIDTTLFNPIFPLYFPLSFPYDDFLSMYNSMSTLLQDYVKTNTSDYTAFCDLFSTIFSITYNESIHILTIHINQNLKWYDRIYGIHSIAFEGQWNIETGQLIKYQIQEYTSSLLNVYTLQNQTETQKANFNFFIWIGMLILGIGGGVGIILRKKHDQLQDSFGEQITKSQCRDPELCCPNGICED